MKGENPVTVKLIGMPGPNVTCANSTLSGPMLLARLGESLPKLFTAVDK